MSDAAVDVVTYAANISLMILGIYFSHYFYLCTCSLLLFSRIIGTCLLLLLLHLYVVADAATSFGLRVLKISVFLLVHVHC